MPIAKTAIIDWIERPLRSVSRLKKLTPEEVRRRVNNLEPRPQFHSEPRHHQLVGFLAASRWDSLMIMFGLGLGKTYLSLMIISDKIKCGVAKRALVLVPTVTVCGVWEDEARQHAPHLRVQVIDAVGSVKRTAQAINPDIDIVVVTYQGFLALCSKSEKSKKTPKKNNWVIGKHADNIIKTFDIMICDESTSLKSSDSLYFRLCRKIAKHTRFRYCLTGTPFGSNVEDLWSQYYVIDFGETLGESLSLLREACFEGVPGHFGGMEWNLKPSRKPDIRRFLDHSTLKYSEKECFDLPPQIFQTIVVPSPADMRMHYEMIVQKFRESQGHITVMQNNFVLMRQLTSGFMTARDADGEKIYANFNPNPKLDAARELIELVPPDRKMIIYHSYVHTGEIIASLFENQLRLKFERVWGQATKKNERINRFRNDPECRFLILNDQAGALGLNLQAANYVIYYECPLSPIVRQQADKRAHRSGQTETVHYYDLVMKGTVDVKILNAVKAGKHLMEEILGGRATV